jgi:general secretion pathway protein A
MAPPPEINILRAIQFSLTPMAFFLKKMKWWNSIPSDANQNLLSGRISYEKFFGFSRDPFAPQPDPRHIFLTDNVREVWNSILTGITQRKGFLLLTGEKGMGKTTLISLIYLYLATNVRKVKVIPPFDSPHQVEGILQAALQGLGGSPVGKSKGSMLSQLEEDLTHRSRRGQSVAFIFDEAQNLRRETLEELRLLANPNPKTPTLLQEIFVGDLQFEKNLNSRGLAVFNQSFEVRCRLRPFTPRESLGYIEHRLKKAGSTISRVFTANAVFLITQASGGNPGTLNRVCQEALSVGFSRLKKKIDPVKVREALAALGMEKEHGWLLSQKGLPRVRKGLGKSLSK